MRLQSAVLPQLASYVAGMIETTRKPLYFQEKIFCSPCGYSQLCKKFLPAGLAGRAAGRPEAGAGRLCDSFGSLAREAGGVKGKRGPAQRAVEICRVVG